MTILKGIRSFCKTLLYDESVPGQRRFVIFKLTAGRGKHHSIQGLPDVYQVDVG